MPARVTRHHRERRIFVNAISPVTWNALPSRSVTPTPTSAQKAAVFLALVASALSLSAVVVRACRDGAIDATPLFGGLLMLLLGIGGYLRLRKLQP